MQEEEEKRLREEEEARLKCEKEELERLEVQRMEKEKWHQLEIKDLERRHEELEELRLLEGCFLEAEKLKRDIRSLSQWKHYIQCDGSPNPLVPQEMNTFISLWEEETNQTFEDVIEKSKLVLHLIEKLKSILLETPPYDLEERNVTQYQGSILQLQELLHLKFNIATEILLRQASTLADLDTGNMEKVIQDENVTLYVWANLKKNPRYRSVRFSETRVGFEIPRILATSDIALRLLHTQYDHVTPLHPVLVPTPPSSAPVIGTQGVQPNQDGGKDAEDQEGPKLQRISCSSLQDTEVKCNEQEDTEEHMTSVKEEFDNTICNLEKRLSETVAAAQLALIQNAPQKPDISGDRAVDLCQFMILGGVYHLDILELPPQCRLVKGWMMVEILKEGLQKFGYPPEITEDLETENTFPPIEVTVEICKKVTFFEAPMVVRWDAQGQHWRTDGISDTIYRPEDRLITFNLDTLGPVSLAQDAHVNMPYLSWELRPLDTNSVLLMVTTLFTEIQVHIRENLCMLASVTLRDREHPLGLEGKWMALVPFTAALREAGLNIFPTAYSHFYVVVNKKEPAVEVKAYRQMALLSSAFAFGWSKWNRLCNSTNVVFKVREHLPEEPTDTLPWSLLMFSGNRARRLRIGEDSEAFSEALKDGTELHSTLYHMLKDLGSSGAMERVRGSSCQLTDTVCHMLLATRVLSYA
ncbi:dynein axonemal intermediate chain 7 [Ctenodactylus gundi]